MRLSFIIVAGGFEYIKMNGTGTITSVEAFTGDLERQRLPDLPEDFMGGPVFMHNGHISTLGSCNSAKDMCFQLDHGIWKPHGTVIENRFSSTVTTKAATFIFGGELTSTTYEYLPKDSKSWLMGKTEIPGGYSNGCAIAVKSDQEIWLIGGYGTEKRILSFDVNDYTF